jgi:hypothetical protein
MWARTKAFCMNSLTVAWGYLLALGGVILQAIDSAADTLGDPDIKNQVSAAIGDAKTAGRILLGISVVTIIARLRSIRKGA